MPPNFKLKYFNNIVDTNLCMKETVSSNQSIDQSINKPMNQSASQSKIFLVKRVDVILHDIDNDVSPTLDFTFFRFHPVCRV